MKSLFIQQRKNIRVACRVKVKIQRLADLKVIVGVTRNVSARGLLVFTDEELEAGTPVAITLEPSPESPLSTCEILPKQLRGRVARSFERSVALTFDDLSPEQEQSLRSAVFRQTMGLMERISDFPAFKDLTELDQLTLTTVCHEVHLKQGEELARLGDEATSLFLVKSGRVQLLSPFDESEDRHVDTAHAGQVFGEVSALLGLPHNLDIVAEIETQLLAFPRESLIHLREQNPLLALALYEIFTAFMGRRLRRLTVRMFSPVSC